MTLKTRIAPTPSGFLHAGNLFNFCITYTLAKSNGAGIKLRIDDADSERMRIEYLDDIFKVLDWMGIRYDEGPADVSDFLQNHRQEYRAVQYNNAIAILQKQQRLFLCPCSRVQLALGNHTSECNLASQQSAIGALRLKMEKPEQVSIQDIHQGLVGIEIPSFPQPVIRKKDGMASYNICSLVDDITDGTNLIVRGADLLPQTALQVFLSHLLPSNQFAQTQFLHHTLLSDGKGQKLSKSAGAQAHSIVGDIAAKQFVLKQTAAFLGVAHQPNSIDELVEVYTQLGKHDKRHVIFPQKD